MKRRLSHIIFFGILMIIAGDLLAQTVNISAEVRPRYEMRHGYKTLFPDGATAANFVSQRTRLNGFFGNEHFKAYVSFQDVRVWGDVSQLNTRDINGLSVHEAWGQVFVGKIVSLKFGRQEIIYDDQRIFGSVGWAQQARSHDAFIVGLKASDNHKIDIGIAYNALQESLYQANYMNPDSTAFANYKTFQLIRYHGKIGKAGLSVLFLNNGMAYDADNSININEKITYSQTLGARFSFKDEKVKFNVAAYYQGGKNNVNRSLSALYFGGDVSLHLVKGFSFGLGGEYLSGTASKDQADAGYTDKSFTPFYGTNHKFNGWMDYFYVGNHGGNVGLIDIYLPLVFNIKKLTFSLIPHYFMAAAKVSEPIIVDDRAQLEWKDYSKGLGTEVDFSIAYAVSNSVVIAGGYSQMFATETMQFVKYPKNASGDFNKNTNNWGWIMITFKPMFISKK